MALSSPYIETEHLLLGLLRECQFVRERLSQAISNRIRQRFQLENERRQIFTSVDLPLSAEAKRMLAFGHQEAELLGHRHIDCEHLFIGFLQLTPSAVHHLIEEQEGSIALLLAATRNALGYIHSARVHRNWRTESSADLGLYVLWISELDVPLAAELATPHRRLSDMVLHCAERMDQSAAYGDGKLRRNGWTRKRAMAHLNDWSSQYRLWLECALNEPYLRADRFPAEEWATEALYHHVPWDLMVNSWFYNNCLLLSMMAALPSSKADLPCRIGIEPPVDLKGLLLHYVAVVEDTMEQVLAYL